MRWWSDVLFQDDLLTEAAELHLAREVDGDHAGDHFLPGAGRVRTRDGPDGPAASAVGRILPARHGQRVRSGAAHATGCDCLQLSAIR